MSSNIPTPSDSSQGEGAPWRPAPVPADELLPPVEPPSARFIIQLFVIPALIVAGVVLVWFVIESLARSGEQDPDKIVAALRSSNQARFQRGAELANMLRQPQRYPGMKSNRELAQKLAAYLDELIAAGNPSDAAVSMRDYLVAALGEFHVADGLPAIIKAALEDKNPFIRRRAIDAIAVLAEAMANLNPPQPLANEELTAALVKLADDQDELVRSQTAFAIGVVASSPGADPQLAAALEALADDPFTDARFNAAQALARIGSPRAAAAVAEMLDPQTIEASLSGEQAMTAEVPPRVVEANKDFKRKVIISGALKSVDRLLEAPALPAENFAPLAQALHKFVDELPEMGLPAKVQEELATEAGRTLERVEARMAGR